MKRGKVIIISGPSGSGKTTLHKALLENKTLKRKLVKSISITTRFPRPGEKGGKDYLFISQKLFFHKRRADHFLEWQKVFDNYYGTPKRAVENLLRHGKNVLLCIDVKGAKVASRKYPEAVKIFIMPPSFEILKKRLQKRASENTAGLRLRLETARREIGEAKEYQYVIVNDRLTKAINCLESIIHREIN